MMIAPRRIVVMTMVLAIMTIAPAMAQSDLKAPAMAQETRLTLGTATPGGGFPVYGAAFVETVKEADPSLVVEAKNTMGSAENIPLLEEGRLDLALVQGEAAHEAFAGIGTRPLSFESAPYFAALVASSCSAMAMASAARGASRTSGPVIANRAARASRCAASASSTMSRSDAPSQLSRVSTSCALASANSRASKDSRPCAVVSLVLRLCAAIDCTVASVFFTR